MGFPEETKQYARLPSEHLQAIRNAGVVRAAEAGTVIFLEGDAGDGLYLISEGKVEISASLGGDAKKVFSTAGPDELFGEMAVIEDAPRSASATALTPVRLHFVPRDGMLQLIQKSSPLAISLLRLISGRLREFNARYLSEMLQAERLSAVGKFTRAIMHDLKNPLNVIGLSAELAAMPDATAEERRKACSDIQLQLDIITSMATEVLEFAGGPSSAKVVPATMPYRDFISDLLREFSAQAAHHGATIECEDPLPATVLPLNPKRLKRAFSNLLVNALEAMPAGGKIFIRAHSNGAEIVTEIEDTGPGIPAQVQEHLFEPFTTWGKPFGTGLGLSICQRVIEDHGGSIRHKPQPGKGAFFVIALPIKPSAAHASSPVLTPSSS